MLLLGAEFRQVKSTPAPFPCILVGITSFSRQVCEFDHLLPLQKATQASNQEHCGVVILGARFCIVFLQCLPCDFWDSHGKPLGVTLAVICHDCRICEVSMVLDSKGTFGRRRGFLLRAGPSQHLD